MDYIYAELDPNLIPQVLNKLYYGSLDNIPSVESLPELNSFNIDKPSVNTGILLPYTTSEFGQYEVFIYPKVYGELESITSTLIGINTIGAWTRTQLTYLYTDYFVYYTTLKQYQDSSTLFFEFKGAEE